MTLQNDLFKEIIQLPVIDVHSHMIRNRIAAESIDDLLYYHMLMYPMRALGPLAPKEQRQGNQWLPYEEYLRRFPLIANTGFGSMLQMMLRDLYDFDEPLTAASFPRAQQAFARKNSQPTWAQQVMDRMKMVSILSSHTEDLPPVAPGEWDGNIRFTIEKGFGSTSREAMGWPERMRHFLRRAGGEALTIEKVRESADAYYGAMDWSDKHALVAWISAMCDFTPIPDADADALIARAMRGERLGVAEGRLLEAQLIRAMCHAIKGRTGNFQICYGVQFLGDKHDNAPPVLRAAPEFASTFGYLAAEFPHIHFNILSGYEPDEPIWCGLTQAYHNVSLACFWWETFYPSVIERALSRRLDMVPLPKLMGFFSDGRAIEYVYGRLRVVQRSLACALADKVERGYYSTKQALAIAEHMMLASGRDQFLAQRP